MSESSYKVYASEEYVDQRVPPSPDGTHKMLVTDADGNVGWEEKPFYQEVVTKEDSVVVTTGGVNAFYDDGYGYILNRKKYIHEGAWFTFVIGDDSVSCAAADIPANNYTNVAVGGINIEVQSRSTPKTGLYCLRLISVYSGEVYISYNYPVVRQIEEIFVPDTIARTSDIPAAVTDDHINTLIDTKLEGAGGGSSGGVILVGQYDENDNYVYPDETMIAALTALQQGKFVAYKDDPDNNWNMPILSWLMSTQSPDGYRYLNFYYCNSEGAIEKVQIAVNPSIVPDGM